ncbi:hypothetical protein N510_000182 [Firmicutes bacterium ASF500]|nr:hypothetical protein N510_000182 [Firmicutes bacterium ASF500]
MMTLVVTVFCLTVGIHIGLKEERQAALLPPESPPMESVVPDPEDSTPVTKAIAPKVIGDYYLNGLILRTDDAFQASHGIQAGRKSVYSDIQILIDQGMDIVCVKSTQNRYFVGSRLFELPELKLLVDAVESSHFITRKKSASLIQKLASLTSQEQAKQLNRPVYMEGTAKQDNEAIYYAVDMIHTAIQEKRRIAFQYIEYTAEKEKVLNEAMDALRLVRWV